MASPTPIAIVLGAVLVSFAYCDTPANCTFEDIHGKWTFLEAERKFNSSLNCTDFNVTTAVHITHLTLQFPNVAFDEFGNKGFWTIIYNQGFEVVINYRKYFAFSYYKQDSSGAATSQCDKTLPGWSHDVLGHNWACYIGKKNSDVSKIVVPKPQPLQYKKTFSKPLDDLVDEINRVQNSWTAFAYPYLNDIPVVDLVRRSGGLKSRLISPPANSKRRAILSKYISALPEEFDWRDVKGINYVSPVRNQGSCGSCYAFSSLAMLESRLRIMTNNSVQVQFSPQDVVSCSEYSQGCEGGFPYVIAGKYGQDFGLLPEDCYPYEGKDDSCKDKSCKRYYVARYNYVGGFFGGCNEDVMKLDLIRNGPVTVAFEVYPDFQMYSGGIYHHTGVGSKFNPFHLVNHGVLITGYGVDGASGEKFWIVKNSWGAEWGEQGYFRIRRGNNECNIESMAVSAIPIP